MTDHLSHDDLVLHFYGEAGAEGARLEAHLDACGPCRDDLAALQHTLALVNRATEGEAPPGFEATMWARLQAQLERPQPWWRRLFADGPVRWAMAATLAAALLGAFLAGWLAREVVAPPAAPEHAEGAAPGPARVLTVAVGHHLERTQMMLAEVMNAGDLAGAALTDDRSRAIDLVTANRLFRQSAALAGDQAIDDVLDDLERVLVEIANAPADLSAAEFAALRERIERRGLVFRVRVLSDQLRVREHTEPAQQTKGLTS